MDAYLSFSDFSEHSPGVYPVCAPLPDDMQFGLSNRCNYHCVFCSEHYPGNTVTPRRFSDKMRRDMLAVLPHIKEAAFHENSEFFVDAQFLDILERCSEHRVTLSLNTNGSYLPQTAVKALDNYRGHLNIAISLDAATPETYWKLRGYDFTKVIRNVKTMIRIIQKKERYLRREWCPTHTTAAFIIMGENKDEALAFLEMADELGFDRVSYYRLHDNGGWICRRGRYEFDYQAQGSWNFKAAYNHLIKEIEAEAKKRHILYWLPEPYPQHGKSDATTSVVHSGHLPHRLPRPEEAPICVKPWTGRVVINAFGGIHPCCHNWDVIGRINERNGFMDAWNSPKAQAFRKALIRHRFPKTCRNGSCPVYRTWLLGKTCKT